MFIRFSLPKIFRLRGRSRKTEKQQLSSSDTIPQVPVPAAPSTVTPPSKAPASALSPDPFASDLTIVRPSPEHYVRVSSSLSHNSDSGSSACASEMQIPIIVIDHDAAAAAAVPVQVIEPQTTPAFLTTIPLPAKSSLRTNRSKSIMLAVTKSSSKLSADEMKPRRATMGARPTAKRVSKRETKIEFSRRNSRRESQQFDFLRNSKRASEITLVGESAVDSQGKPEVEVEPESKRKSMRETRRVSKMSSPKQKRQSRWEKEINDPNTQEVLRALSGLN